MVWAVAERGSTRNGYKDGWPLDQRQAARKVVRTVLKKDWNFRLQKPHYVQELTPEDCDRRTMRTSRMACKKFRSHAL
jgi:hypothetical protein